MAIRVIKFEAKNRYKSNDKVTITEPSAFDGELLLEQIINIKGKMLPFSEFEKCLYKKECESIYKKLSSYIKKDGEKSADDDIYISLVYEMLYEFYEKSKKLDARKTEKQKELETKKARVVSIGMTCQEAITKRYARLYELQGFLGMLDLYILKELIHGSNEIKTSDKG